MSFSHKLVAIALAVAVFLTVTVFLSGRIYGYLDVRSIHVVGRQVPSEFPVVVFQTVADSSRVARAVYYAELQEQPTKASTSFLVPAGGDSAANRDLCHQTRSRRCNDPHHPLAYTASIAVISRHDDVQVIRAEYSWDAQRKKVGWYEASSVGIVPLRFQDFAWVRALQISWLAASLCGAVLSNAFLFASRAWWKRSQTVTVPDRPTNGNLTSV